MTKDQQYKIDLAKAVKTSIHSHILKTPEKEVIVTDFDPMTGNLTIWVDGIYRVTVENMVEKGCREL